MNKFILAYYTLIQTQDSSDFVSLCHGRAVCVKVDGTFGVVCLSAGRAVCANCKYGHCSCKHVQYLLSFNKDVEKYSLVSEFLDVLQAPQPVKANKTVLARCLSKTKIPFRPSASQQIIMKQPSSVRYNILDGNCVLVPAEIEVCPSCGCCDTYSEMTHVRDATVVTFTELIHAKGMFDLFSFNCIQIITYRYFL